MKLHNRVALATAAAFALVWATACQSNPETKNEAVNQSAANKTQTNANTTAAVPTPTTDKTTGGSLSTPTEAYKTAYAARKKKDVEGLKRVMSKDALGFFTSIAEADKKTLDDMLKELTEKPQASTDETRNEKVSGDRATLEYLDEKGQWKTMDFAKEGGDWKLTLPKAERPDAGGMPKKP